jgi:NAD(P)-dependent dehydrogenase (short-subunit alcohol dehydrogenase family)
MEGFQNPNIRRHVLDVTNGDDIERAVQTVLAEAGKIDIVVNNAGATAIGESLLDRFWSGFGYSALLVILMLQYETIMFVSRSRSGSHHRPNSKRFRVEYLWCFALVKRGDTFHVQAQGRFDREHWFHRKSGVSFTTCFSNGIGQANFWFCRTTPWNTLYCAAKAALHSISEGLAMECRPFGVKVMLVAPGGVTSNIAKNQAATLTLSPTTMYKDYESKIHQRMNASQGRGSMDTNEFARKVVTQALSASPPPYMTLGYNSTLFYFLQWLPRQYALERMYKALIG